MSEYQRNEVSPGTATSSYKDSGVDVEAADRFVESIVPLAKRTFRSECMGTIGGFGALFEVPKGYKNPVLVSSTDGVGTKLKIAFEMQQHNTIGIDLVAMCVNDIVVHGAEPLYFLDYFATGRLEAGVARDVVEGIGRGCEISGCALIGGETAEMPGIYASDEYDLAGFAVGIVEKKGIIDGADIQSGDVIIGISSSGFHSNGYSLIRKILHNQEISLTQKIEGTSVGSFLMQPTTIYVPALLEILKEAPVHGMAHITGGGIPGNVKRVVRDGLTARIFTDSWTREPMFTWLQSVGKIPDDEMLATFNCGIGFVLVVPQDSEQAVKAKLEAHRLNAFTIGEIIKTEKTDRVELIHE